jgi:DNA-binding MarR family transcriptional regulator
MKVMESSHFLIVPLLQGFVWFDESLQNYLRQRGWPAVTRPQSMVMVSLVRGITRPSDIARDLGVTRQAVHATINGMIEIGLVELVDDPSDRRSKIVAISGQGSKMREHAREASALITEALAQRIGADNLEALRVAMSADWGEPLSQFDAAPSRKVARRS